MHVEHESDPQFHAPPCWLTRQLKCLFGEPDRPSEDSPKNIASSFVGRLSSVSDSHRQTTDMVGQDPVGGVDLVLVRLTNLQKEAEAHSCTLHKCMPRFAHVPCPPGRFAAPTRVGNGSCACVMTC